MKKGKLSKIFALTGVLLLGGITAMSVVSCGSDTASVIVVITGGKNGYVGGLCQLTATVYGYEGNDEVTWTSSNTTVATVDSTGLVSYLSAGTVEITATVGENSSSPCELKVTAGDAALELTSSPSRLSYYTGEKLSFDGMKVTGYSYVNGYRANDSGVDLTNADLTFSIEEGTELTDGEHTITISYGSFASTSFTVTVGNTITEKKLYVSSNPNTSTYVIGDSTNENFVSTGLVVQGLTYVDGELTEQVTLTSNEYSLSINNSQQLLTEGSKTIYVYADGYISTSFNIMVYTLDTTIRDYIGYLIESDNYQVEIFNNVGTTSDSYGFHYLRTYTETYYDEISYQNTYNSTTSQIEFSTLSVKSHVAYADFTYGSTSGIVSVSLNSGGRFTYDTIVSTTYTSWWDMADTLATMLTTFDLDDLPYYTLNDTYLAIVVEQVANDDDSGTKTLANYPLLEQFFSFVGWSSTLITITDRMTISFNSSGNLEMRVDFGYYGYTSFVIQNVGTASNSRLQNFLNSGIDEDDWATIMAPSDDVIDAVEPLFDNNYTVVDYEDDTVYAYFTDTYYYYPSGRTGYFLDESTSTVYSFTASNANVFTSVTASGTLGNDETFAEYVTSLGSDLTDQYITAALPDIFGDGDEDYGELHMFSRYDGFSYGDMVTYQTFDNDVVNSFYNNYVGSSGTLSETYRFWMCAYYEDVDALDGIYEYEFWVIDYSSLRGYVSDLINVGTTSLTWLETAISGYLN